MKAKDMKIDSSLDVIKLEDLNITVEVNANPGVYTFSPFSTGKTRLANIITDYMKIRDDVLSITYNDYIKFNKGDVIKELANPKKHKLIVIDRFDLYDTIGEETLKECAKHAVVLIDSKRGIEYADDIAVIDFDEYYIGVRV